MRSIKKRWRWGPVALGLSVGISLAVVPGVPLWLWVGVLAGGFVTSLVLVAAPPALDAIGGVLVGRAYRAKGLLWPPPTDPERVHDLREALEVVAVELENNALVLERASRKRRYWNASARPLAAIGYGAHSAVLQREASLAPLFRLVSSLYNEASEVNYDVSNEWALNLNRHPTKQTSIDDKEAERFDALAGQMRQAQYELTEHADSL